MTVSLTVEPEVDAVRIEATLPAGTDRFSIVRSGPSDTSTGVRHYVDAVPAATDIDPGPLLARDFEAPIGVELTYTVTHHTASGEASESATVTIPSEGCGDTWLTDLVRPGNTLRVIIESLPALAYSIPTQIHWILGRRAPIVTSDVANTPTFELSVLTDTDYQRVQVRDVLGNGVPVLLRTPPEDGIGSLYFAVLSFSEQRIVGSGTHPARLFAISAVQIERPDPALYIPLLPTTYDVVKATFATYAALKAERANYDALAYDYSAATPGGAVPWPPMAWLPADV